MAVALLALALAAVLLAAVLAVRRRDAAREQLIEELELRAGELESVNADLNRSNAQLEEFASIACHDLREPLLVIAGFSGLLKRRAGDQLDPEAQRFVDNIGLGVERMQLMIDGLLAYSRAGRGAEQVVELQASEPLKAAIVSLKVEIDELGARITLGQMPTLRADPTGLEQLFANLIGNALKFTDGRAPEIEVSARPCDGLGWEFSVADNGVGIDPERRDDVFEMFRRLHPASVPGAGIGLATCRRIAEVYGGRIWVEAGPQGGSVFRFTIPERDAPLDAAAQPAPVCSAP